MRRPLSALILGCMLLATPVAANAAVDAPASLATAYNNETDHQFRVGLQMRLAWAGDYSGAFDGEINAASLRAIRDFQARHGMPATGVISEAMLRDLIALSDGAEAAVGFKLVDDETTGLRIALPLGLVKDGGSTEVGRVWRSADRAIEIEAVRLAGAGQTLDALFDTLRRSTEGRTVSDARLSTDGFTVSGVEAGHSYVMRFGGVDGDVRGYVVSFAPQEDTRMRAFTTVAMGLFDPAGSSDLRLVHRDAAPDEAAPELANLSAASVADGEPSLLNARVDADLGTGSDASSGIDSSGTGFVVSRDGWLLTNAHVAKSCRSILVGNQGAADRVVVDETSDLALVHVSADLGEPLRIATGMPRLGEDILALGYPLRSILADSLNVTRGNVSSLLGLMNDARYLQISAPVQPGNSGGPLVDLSGRVVGVVTAKLNAVAIADATGDIPQSINFAIRPDEAVKFLRANDIDFVPAGKAGAPASVADTTESVQNGILPVLCVGGDL